MAEKKQQEEKNTHSWWIYVGEIIAINIRPIANPISIEKLAREREGKSIGNSIQFFFLKQTNHSTMVIDIDDD